LGFWIWNAGNSHAERELSQHAICVCKQWSMAARRELYAWHAHARK
jgi:hypothetical protein